VKVIKRTLVKQVLTLESKNDLFQKLEREKKRIQNECEQLDFEKRKAMKHRSKKDQTLILGRFEEEIERRKQKIRSIDFQIEQLHYLPLGTEIVEKEIEAIQDVQVGDDWNQLFRPSEIVVKEGKVIEIRP